MATLQATTVAGNLSVTGSPVQLISLTNAQTGSYVSTAGNIWYNTTTGRMTYTNGSTTITV